MSPTFVEHVIKNGEKTIEVEVRNGIKIERSIFKLDGCKVVAEQNGKLIITINPYSGGM